VQKQNFVEKRGARNAKCLAFYLKKETAQELVFVNLNQDTQYHMQNGF